MSFHTFYLLTGLDSNASNMAQSVNEQFTNSPCLPSALPFQALGLNAQQGVNCPHMESSVPTLPSGFLSPLIMNEISNTSQQILRLYSKIALLSQELATTQADLLVAHVIKFISRNNNYLTK